MNGLKGFFVTGTGTGVGKTFVSVAIIGALRETGIDACGIKPVETGCGLAGPADGLLLREASGTDEPIGDITPYALRAPLAPLVAARMEGCHISHQLIMDKARGLASRHDALVVEGVGGFLVPISAGYLVRDMALAMGMPVVVVASPYLGTINHTLLTVESIRNSGLELAGVVLSSHFGGGDDESAVSNPAVIEELTGMPLIGALPYVEGAGLSEIMDAGSRYLDTDMLRRSFLP